MLQVRGFPKDGLEIIKLENAYLGLFDLALELSHCLQVFSDVHAIKSSESALPHQDWILGPDHRCVD